MHCETTEKILEHAYLSYYNHCRGIDIQQQEGRNLNYRNLANTFFAKLTRRQSYPLPNPNPNPNAPAPPLPNATLITGPTYGSQGNLMSLTEAITFLTTPQGNEQLVRNDLRINQGNRNFVLGQLETITGFDFPGQQARIQDLEARIQDLEARIRQLQNRNQELQTRNQDGQQAQIQNREAQIEQLQANQQLPVQLEGPVVEQPVNPVVAQPVNPVVAQPVNPVDDDDSWGSTGNNVDNRIWSDEEEVF